MKPDLKFADLFAGGGGVTSGAISIPGIKVTWALNHSKTAIECHAKNHPETRHYKADIRTQDITELEEVDILWASTECTQHSKAKGGAEKEIGSYTLGWEILRYISHCRPSVIHIENVPEFVKWSPVDSQGDPIKTRQGEEFQRWVAAIQSLGYPNYEHRFLNAADFECPTRRIRYFGIFTAENVIIQWPNQSHNEKGTNGLKRWIPCRDFLKLENEGISIFGRSFNDQLPKQHRHQLSINTIKRIVGGIKKFAPEMYLIMTYHGSGHNCQTIDEPISTISTVEAKALIKIEKLQFIQEHCYTSNYNLPDEPINPLLCRETKELVTIKHQFLSKQYNSNGHPEVNNQSVELPIGALTTEPKNQLISVEVTKEKVQFISSYFNSGGHPESQNQSIDKPINTILTECNKKALVTLDHNLVDFDIKMRFLDSHSELGPIMGFPEGYFEGYSKKSATKMIGNAVPSGMAKVLIAEMKRSLEQSVQSRSETIHH